MRHGGERRTGHRHQLSGEAVHVIAGHALELLECHSTVHPGREKMADNPIAGRELRDPITAGHDLARGIRERHAARSARQQAGGDQVIVKVQRTGVHAHLYFARPGVAADRIRDAEMIQTRCLTHLYLPHSRLPACAV